MGKESREIMKLEKALMRANKALFRLDELGVNIFDGMKHMRKLWGESIRIEKEFYSANK